MPAAQPQPGHDPATLIPVLGALVPGTPVAFEAADGWAGWSSCWKSWSWSRTWSIPPRQGDRLGPGQARQGGCGHLGPAVGGGSAARGLDRPHQGRELRACCVTGSAWSAWAPPARTGCRGAGRSRHRRGPDPVDWSRAGLAGQPRAAAHPRAILQDCCGLLDALATPIPRLEREIDALAKPDPRSGPHGAARRWPVDGQDVGRRARRPRPLPDRPQRCAGAGLPLRCATPTASSAMATSPSRLTLGAPDPAGGRPEPTPAHGRRRLRRPGPPSGQPHRHHRDHPPVAGPLLPHPHPSLAPAPKKAGPGRVRVCACAGNTAVDRPAQPGSGLPVMRTPPSGPDGCRRANSDPPSGPSPPSRSAIGHSHRPTSRPVPPRPTTRPSPIGAETPVRTTIGRHLLARRKPGVQIPSPPPPNSPGHRPSGSPPPGRCPS